MTGFEEVVAALAEAVPVQAGSPAEGAEIRVTDVRLDLPLEARLGLEGLWATLPRGLFSTGFDPALDRVQLTFVARGDV